MSAPLNTPPVPGADNYCIGREIATGGMGSIMEAGDSKLGRTVAIKVMLLEAEADAGLRRRFIREAEILAMLAHPNIVPIYDIIWENGQPLFYTMKLVKGRTLQDILDALTRKDAEAMAGYPLDRLLLIFRKACDAVAFAHSRQVLHRDLKPENIMVGEFGEVLVMDWGIAKRMGEAEGAEDAAAALEDSLPAHTLQGVVMGTPHYMSPEQAQGFVDDLDSRSDIFALGGILHSILTLRPPVEGKTTAEVLGKVRRGETSSALLQAQPLPHLPGRRVPAALAAVAARALHFEKHRRYPGVSALTADLEAYQTGFATSAEEAGTLTHLRLLVVRHKVVALSLAVLLASGAAFVWQVMASGRRATASDAISRASLAESRKSLAKERIAVAEAAFRRADLFSMIKVLDQTEPELRNQAWDYLSSKRDSSHGLLEITGFTQPTDVAAVPGQRGVFALAARDGRVGFVSASTGTLLRSFDSGTPGDLRMAFSADGKRLLCHAHPSEQARIFDAATGGLTASLTVPSDALPHAMHWSNVALSGDGALAVVANRQNETFQVFDTASGQVKWSGNCGLGRMIFHPREPRLYVLHHIFRGFTIYDTTNGREIVSRPFYADSLALNAEGTTLAIGFYTGEVALLDALTGTELRRAQLHSNVISAIAWTAGGNLLTLGGEGRYESARFALRLWDPVRFSARGILFGAHFRDPYLHASYDGASGCLLTLQSPPQLWQINDRALAVVPQESEQGWSCAFLSETELLGREAFDLRCYDVTDPRSPQPHGSPFDTWHALSTAHPASGRFAIAKPIPGGMAPSISQFVMTEHEPVREWTRPQGRNTVAMDFSADGLTLLTLSDNGCYEILDATGGALRYSGQAGIDRAVLCGRANSIAGLERHRASADTQSDRLVLLDPVNGRTKASLTTGARLNALAVSPDRRTLAIAGDDQDILLLDAETLEEKQRFRSHDAAISALRFDPSRPRLASASVDGILKIWDLPTLHPIHTIYGLAGRPVCLSFSPKGNLLAVEGMEYAFRIYEMPPF